MQTVNLHLSYKDTQTFWTPERTHHILWSDSTVSTYKAKLQDHPTPAHIITKKNLAEQSKIFINQLILAKASFSITNHKRKTPSHVADSELNKLLKLKESLIKLSHTDKANKANKQKRNLDANQ